MHALPDHAGLTLLQLARRAIETRLDHGSPERVPHEDEAWLDEPGAVFVTLTQSGRLRGCIGSLEAWRPLRTDVRANARAAAFDDPRFPPLDADELARTRVEVSLLTTPEPMSFTDEADAVAQLRPGVDGVVLEASVRRGTFLPQVWDELPDPVTFLAHLKRKAGLPATWWGAGVRLSRYTVTKWKEEAR